MRRLSPRAEWVVLIGGLVLIFVLFALGLYRAKVALDRRAEAIQAQTAGEQRP